MINLLSVLKDIWLHLTMCSHAKSVPGVRSRLSLLMCEEGPQLGFIKGLAICRMQGCYDFLTKPEKLSYLSLKLALHSDEGRGQQPHKGQIKRAAQIRMEMPSCVMACTRKVNWSTEQVMNFSIKQHCINYFGDLLEKK